MKKLLITMLTLLFASAMALGQEPVQPSGSGTEISPYQIATWQNLYWISLHSASWDKYFEQTADIDFADTNITDWDGGAGWTPIGNGTIKFTGSYDGQNHTISNLYINRSNDYIGLFGYIDGSGDEVKNLGLIDVNITGASYVGGFVGRNHSATISNSYSTGAVSGKTSVGGFVGQNSSSAIISNSYSTVVVSGTVDYVGGFVGYNSSATISNSYSTGTVSGTNFVGGFVGQNYSYTISNSYSTGAVSGKTSVGGFVGYNNATISNSYSRGAVTRASGSTNEQIGGFCGYNYDGATINYCYSTGSVSYTGYTNPTDKGFVGPTSSGTYNANFFDSEASGQITGTGATAKTTIEMKTLATFTSAGWDFEGESANDSNDYWDLSGSINDGYPYLSWQDGEDRSLPVELTDFAAVAQSSGVALSWTTESETENLGFIIQRRQETGDWKQVANYLTDMALEGHGSTSEKHEYAYTDAAIVPGATYLYRLGDVDYSGKVTLHKEVEVKVEVEDGQTPTVFGLQAAYPNPFNPSVTIPYGLIENGQMSLKVYNLRGELVETLISAYALKGAYSLNWQPQNLSAGIYLIRMQSGNHTSMQKVVFVK
ncbi:MAG: T9SS type A sorting domain-containing protein [Candidatus Marinimicrobia bacterium]|nr:T9SS type A sorting domain-containing protein [Candidatus Neomarinimicrobiota bacterium]